MRWVLSVACLLVAAEIAGAAPSAPLDRVAVAPPAGARVPADAAFVDTDGEPVALGDYFGRGPVVLAPVYFSCPNICGVTLDGLALALSQMPLDLGRDYRLVAYSLHPGDTPADARDTRARLGRILGRESGAGGAFLTLADGREPTSARRVGDALGFRYAWDEASQQYLHAAGVFVLGSDGSFARWLSGVRFQPTDLRLALLAADDGRIADPAGRALMLCYRYDPGIGAYTPLIENALRVFGGATTFTVGGFIAVALWRERRRRP